MPTARNARDRFADDPRWAGLELLGHGANRLCARDPADPAHCLKFELPPEQRTAVGPRARLMRWFARRFPYFGENAVEWRAWQRLRARLGNALEGRFAACAGLVDTTAGRALRCECVFDRNGRPAPSLYALLSEQPRYSAESLCAAVDDFEAWLHRHRVPMFDLNAGNFVVVEDDGRPRLVCIDGKSTLAAKGGLPFSRWVPSLARRKVARRAERLRRRIGAALPGPPTLR